MTTWQAFQQEAAAFAALVERSLRAHVHLTMATVRADGGPRISGNEIRFAGGELLLAGMAGSRRFADLVRDPRVAVHSGSEAAPDESWIGDAKVYGQAYEVTDPEALTAFTETEPQPPPGPFQLFRIDLTEVSLVRISEAGDALVIQTWRPGAPIQEWTR